MRVPRTIPLGALVALLALACSPAAAQQYVAVFRDGRVVTGESLVGESYHLGATELAGQRLLDSQRPLQLLRDTSRGSEPSPPYVMLLSGDIVPGAVVGYEAAVTADDDSEGYLLVTPRPPLSGVTEGPIRIGIEWVWQIVASQKRGPAEPAAGGDQAAFLVRKDGRTLQARNLRWRGDGVQMLADTGIQQLRFGEIAHLRLPTERRFELMARESMAAAEFGEAGLVTRRLVNGARVSSWRVTPLKLKVDAKEKRRKTYHTFEAIQPLWSAEALLVSPEDVVERAIRQGGELPLFALGPPQPLANQGRRLWAMRLNQSVAGRVLASGAILGDHGLGVHAPSLVEFTVPASVTALRGWVGLDRSSAGGGCVHVAIYRDRPTGEPLWRHRYLQGKDGPVEYDDIEVKGAGRLVFQVDAAHEGRPTGADPLDVRDRVNWIMPLVRIEPESAGVHPALPGWVAAGSNKDSVTDRWSPLLSRWEPVVVCDRDSPARIERTVAVTRENDMLELQLGYIGESSDFEVTLKADGAALEPNVSTTSRRMRSKYDQLYRTDIGSRKLLMRAMRTGHHAITYRWDLARLHGKKAKLSLSFEAKGRGKYEAFVAALAFRGGVRNLPADGSLPQPDVALRELKPLEFKTDRPKLPRKFHPEVRPRDAAKPRRLYGRPYPEAILMRAETSVRYPVPPAARRFVAVIGAVRGRVGPVVVQIDGAAAWSREMMEDDQPPEAIAVPVPAGAKEIEIEIGGEGSSAAYAGLAHAGFVKE